MQQTKSKSRFKETLENYRLIPTYDKKKLFLMSSLFFIILFTKISNLDLNKFISDNQKSIPFLFFLLLGGLYSLYYVFTPKKTPKFAKTMMLFFAIYTNFFVGLYSGFYLLKTTTGLLIIFPLLNILQSFLIIILWDIDVIDEGSILDTQLKRMEILTSFILLLILFFLFQYVFQMYWALTFSICLDYISILSNFVQKQILILFNVKR